METIQIYLFLSNFVQLFDLIKLERRKHVFCEVPGTLSHLYLSVEGKNKSYIRTGSLISVKTVKLHSWIPPKPGHTANTGFCSYKCGKTCSMKGLCVASGMLIFSFENSYLHAFDWNRIIFVCFFLKKCKDFRMTAI